MVISSDKFIWNKTNKTFTAFISDFAQNVNCNKLSTSFTMVSSKTKNLVKFSYNKNLYNSEELYGFEFLPSNDAISKNKNLASVRVIIFND